MKKSTMRPAMRSTSAPPKLAVALEGGGLNLLRYSTLHHPTAASCLKGRPPTCPIVDVFCNRASARA